MPNKFKFGLGKNKDESKTAEMMLSQNLSNNQSSFLNSTNNEDQTFINHGDDDDDKYEYEAYPIKDTLSTITVGGAHKVLPPGLFGKDTGTMPTGTTNFLRQTSDQMYSTVWWLLLLIY